MKLEVISYEGEDTDTFKVRYQPSNGSSQFIFATVDASLLPYLIGEFGDPSELVRRSFELVLPPSQMTKRQMQIRFLGNYSQKQTLRSKYDIDTKLQEIMTDLFPDFEYPDFSHLSFEEIIRKAKRL